MSDPTPPALPHTSIPVNPASPRKGPRLVLWGVVVLIAGLLFLSLQNKPQRSIAVPFSEFTSQLRAGNVTEVVIEYGRVTFSTKPRVTMPTALPAPASFHADVAPSMAEGWPFANWILENANGATVRFDMEQNLLATLLLPLVPWALLFGLLWFFVFRLLKRSNQPQFARPVYIVNPDQK